MIAHEDREMIDWLLNARENGGGFVASIAEAALRADNENYSILRPALLQLKAKYNGYATPIRGGQDAA